MHICYIDESGTSDLSSNTSHFILAGISIPIEHWKDFENRICQIKKKYSLDSAEIHTAYILKKYNQQEKIPNFNSLNYNDRKKEVNKLRHAKLLSLNSRPSDKTKYHSYKKEFKQTEQYIHLTIDERRRFILEIAQLIGKISAARLFAECIDKLHFNQRSMPSTIDEQAFEQIVSRFESYLKIYSKSSKIEQYGLLVHDNNSTVAKKYTEMMKRFHLVGTAWKSVDHIIETPFFVDSQLTGMIQIADVCAYSLRRYFENGEEELFNSIIKRADKKDMKIVGVRHFTDTSCSCLICQQHN